MAWDQEEKYKQAQQWAREQAVITVTGIQRAFKMAYGPSHKLWSRLKEDGLLPLRGEIPPDFYLGEEYPEVVTVEDLIAQLRRLPKNLKVSSNNGVLVVFNVTTGAPYLCLQPKD